MPKLLEGSYAPPGTYTRTEYELPPVPENVPDVIPLFIGTGQEILTQNHLPVRRGSSATADERVPTEDVGARAVRAVNPDGSFELGAFDGFTARFQVRNFPVVTGTGAGAVTTDPADLTVTVNGQPVVVLAVEGSTGLVEIADTPGADDLVQCTYYFDRTDTQATDDVSAQVTVTPAVLDGTAGPTFAITAGVNDRFTVTVDGLAPVTVTLPAGGAVAASLILATLNGASGRGSLVASTFVNHIGVTCIRLTADISLSIGTASANGVLGFVAGAATARRRAFHVFNGPIVTGSGGGVTTTRPSDVTVTVDGVTVAATAVDGRSRTVTLPYAPRAGSEVLITYWHNTWQDTFDYLAHTGVRAITRAAITPESNGAGVYVQGVDYVLRDDTIVWGTAAMVGSGVSSSGGVPFGETQVTARLVDNRVYLAPCTAVEGSAGMAWRLGAVPTTGDGRSSPLGAEGFLAVSNGRSDLPTSNPTLVTLYWGYGAADAMRRGAVAVSRVDPETSTVTLTAAVPEGAEVFASHYYNTLVDAAFVGSGRGYTLTTVTPGNAGVGTYSVTDPQSRPLYGVSLASKGTALSSITVEFPSGSEFLPDARIEGGVPVEETVQVEFASTSSTPARYTAPGAGPYYLAAGASSALRLTVDGVASSTGTAGGINLQLPSGTPRGGAFASLLGGEVPYASDSGETTFEITAGVNDTLSLQVDGVVVTGAASAGAARDIADYATAINAAAKAAPPSYVAETVFDTPHVVESFFYDSLGFRYIGDVSGTVSHELVISNGTYDSAADLAAQITARFADFGDPFLITCTATADSRLKFTLTKDPADSAGFLEFLNTVAPSRDFSLVAGIDVASGSLNQVKLYHGPIATTYTVASTDGRQPYDRLVLRNRIFPGAGSMSPFTSLAQCELRVLGGNGVELAGLTPGAYGEASYRGSALGPRIRARVGWQEAIVGGTFLDERDRQPGVLFYDGTGTTPANNILKITFGGTLVTVTFSGSADGTLTALGPASVSGSILHSINTALAGAPGAPVAVQEGDSICIWGTSAAAVSPGVIWTVGEGTANATLGFTSGEVAAPTPVSARGLASALMAHVQTYSSWIFDPGAVGTGYFASKALAGVVTGPTGEDYLYLQSRTLGSSSSLLFGTATAADALRTGTGLGILTGDSARGRAAVDGFFVTSSDGARGSGSANDSVFNSGVGSDGVVGQTYVDAVTGLRFTILPREGGLAYPTGGLSTVTFRVNRTFLTDSNIPTLALPGVELTVSNTAGVIRGDTARVETYQRGGAEPSIGETYYVSYTYTKTDFSPRIFSKKSDVVAAFGPATPEYPLSLAADIAFDNGAPAVACYQVLKTPGSAAASEAAYLAALEAVAGNSLPGDRSPGILVPLTPATRALARAAAIHADIQSDIRYKAERTVIFGFGAGTRPDQLAAIVQAAGSMRVRFVYPDVATIERTDTTGRTRNHLVDGRFLAAAVAAAIIAPGNDPATPWESFQLRGFSSIARRLEGPVANAIAQLGVTVLETRGSSLVRVRHGLTSDVTSVLTKTPTVVQIADEIQRRARVVGEPFSGKKYLPTALGQLEGRLSEMLKQAVRDQIIVGFRGLKVELDPTDPTGYLIEAWWAPVFPSLYIQFLFRVSASGI